MLDILKDLGKGQSKTIAQGLNDSRWYVVRNVVRILAESKSDQAVIFLEKVAHHKNNQIRQEVIKGLINIGGRRASALLARYLADKDADIQFTALRALSVIHGAGPDEAQALMEFLEHRRAVKNKQENDLTIEAIRTLGADPCLKDRQGLCYYRSDYRKHPWQGGYEKREGTDRYLCPQDSAGIWRSPKKVG